MIVKTHEVGRIGWRHVADLHGECGNAGPDTGGRASVPPRPAPPYHRIGANRPPEAHCRTGGRQPRSPGGTRRRPRLGWPAAGTNPPAPTTARGHHGQAEHQCQQLLPAALVGPYEITGRTCRWKWESGKQRAGWTTSRVGGSLPTARTGVAGAAHRALPNKGGGARPCLQARMQSPK